VKVNKWILIGNYITFKIVVIKFFEKLRILSSIN